MKKVLCFLLFASFITLKVSAQEVEKKDRAFEPSKSIDDFQLAVDLSIFGYEHKDALALAQSAKILLSNPTRDLKPTKSEPSAETTKSEKKSDKPLITDPVKMLADAKSFAGTDKNLLVIVNNVSTESKTARGRVNGAAYCDRRVYSQTSYIDYILFEGGYKAEVAILGDGDNDLDLYIYNSSDELVASDIDYTDRCYTSFYPRYQGTYKIVVKNRGSVYSDYILMSN